MSWLFYRVPELMAGLRCAGFRGSLRAIGGSDPVVVRGRGAVSGGRGEEGRRCPMPRLMRGCVVPKVVCLGGFRWTSLLRTVPAGGGIAGVSETQVVRILNGIKRDSN